MDETIKRRVNEVASDNHEPATDQNGRPLVTFALFAYNQEKYIREAVQGAFAQTYEPLDIILSDDCSTDRTFSIMQEMAATYRGPHNVRAIRQSSNIGTVNHVITVFRLAKGDLVVLSAGDDISYPSRAQIIAEHWKNTGAAALCSHHDEISDEGRALRNDCSFPDSADTARIFAHSSVARRSGGIVQSIPGFCSAYPRSFWAHLPLSDRKLLVEDGIATMILNIRGERIERVERTLIAYRLASANQKAQSEAIGWTGVRRREERIAMLGNDLTAMVDYVIANARPTSPIEPSVLMALKDHQRYGKLVASFWEAPIAKRLFLALRVRRSREFRFIAPRFFGFPTFVVIKRISRWMTGS